MAQGEPERQAQGRHPYFRNRHEKRSGKAENLPSRARYVRPSVAIWEAISSASRRLYCWRKAAGRQFRDQSWQDAYGSPYDSRGGERDSRLSAPRVFFTISRVAAAIARRISLLSPALNALANKASAPHTLFFGATLSFFILQKERGKCPCHSNATWLQNVLNLAEELDCQKWHP